jgi:hypothetical protein
MWNTAVYCKRWRTAALFLSLSGCTALSDCKYELGQKIRTKQAWHEFDGCNEKCFTVDYQSGWKQGYYEVLTGGDGRPPLVPPKKYWKPPVFVEHDPSRQDDWYVGYQDGAANAKCQPDHHYVPTFLPEPSHQTVHMPQELPSYVPFGNIESNVPENNVRGSEMPPVVPIEGMPAERGGEGVIPSSENPAGTDAEKRSAEDYDKDPEQNSTRTESRRNSAVARLVAQSTVRPSSLLDQLVMKANEDSSGSDGN